MRNAALTIATLALAASGCGPSPATPKAIDTLFPKDGEVSGWNEDTTLGKPGVEVYVGSTAVTGAIDGAADSFIQKGMEQMARQYYLKGTEKLEVRIWQMKDAAATKDLWDYLVTSDKLYKAVTWTDDTGGDAARVADTGNNWWFNSRKGLYFVELTLGPNDANGKTDVRAFAGAVVGKM
jgi:hypothetical protein